MTANLEFYEAFASEYRDFYDLPAAREAVEAWSAILRKADLWPPEPITLLDMGCGPGTHLAAWANEVDRVDGLDGSPAMLGAARKSLVAAGLSGVGLYCADVTETEALTPIAGGYDIVAAHFNFLNLFDRGSLDRVAQSLRMLLKPEGIFICDILLWDDSLEQRGERVFQEEYRGSLWSPLGVHFDASIRTIRRDWARDGEGFSETLHLHSLTDLDARLGRVGLEPRLLQELPHPILATGEHGELELDRRLAVFAKAA